jgi:hypothetical protein
MDGGVKKGMKALGGVFVEMMGWEWILRGVG